MCFIGFQRTNHNMNQSNQGEKKRRKKKEGHWDRRRWLLMSGVILLRSLHIELLLLIMGV